VVDEREAARDGWDVEPTEGLNDSNPPFYRWFEDGRLNASAQCLDRHVAAGIGDRVAYHWRGEEGEERRRKNIGG
jgi:acetyl-CoA synthetase